MSIINAAKPFAFGLRDLVIAGSNRLADGYNMASVANIINMLSARRGHVLGYGGVSTSTSTASTNVRPNVFHTSPNMAGVEVLMIMGKTRSSTALGKVTWQVAPTSTMVAVTQPLMYVGGSTIAEVPNDFTILRQRFVDGSGADLAGDTEFFASFTMTDATLQFFIIYEVPKTTLDTGLLGADLGVPMDVFNVNGPILDRDVNNVQSALWQMYRRQGPTQFNWCDAEANGANYPRIQTGTTWKNILDGTTTGYGANAAGFWTIPYRKNRLTGTTVDVKFWAYAGTNVGAGGRVRFSNSAGVLATITGFPAGAPGLVEVAATLDATISTSDLVIAEHSDSLGNSINTYAVGCYEYLT